MNDPQRLLRWHSERGDGLEAALLGSARRDEPPAGSKVRLLATLGVAAGAASAVSAGTAAGAGTGTAAGAAPAGAHGALGALGMVGKWVALGAVSATVAVGTARVVTAPAPPPSVTVVARPVSAAVAVAPASAPAVAPAPASAPAPAPASAPGTAFPPLSAELPFIDLARSSLAKGLPGYALSSLDTYDLRFPHARLAEEARVLRIEALVKLGRTDDARVVADRFLRDAPTSPYAPRVRSLVRDGDNP
jgi:hypothetical protein